MALFLSIKLRRAANTSLIENKKNQLLKDYQEFIAFEQSEELRNFLELEKEINSEEFKLNKKQIKAKRFKGSELERKEKTLKRLLKSNSSQEIENLKAELASEEFISEKKFLLDKKRFEKTEGFKKELTYKELKDSELFKKYFKLQKKNKFHLIKGWELTFYEDFENSNLDTEKWITQYYWGDKLMNAGYALSTDQSIFSENNVKVSNSIARLETKKEKAKGKVWSEKIGFISHDFDYTSALISTGKSFRQKYGLFEAKIKVSDIKNVQHAFWMLSNTSLPHINVAKTSSCGKLFPGKITGTEDKPKINQTKIKGLDWTKDFFIYSLEWTPNKLIWKINDVVVCTQTDNIPNEPMYLIFSSGVLNSNANINAAMEIDWVKCYKKVE